MSNDLLTVCAGVIGVLLTIIGFLITRSINHMEASLNGLIHKVESMAISAGSGEQLRKFQDRRIRKLEQGKEVLSNAFHEMDFILYEKTGKWVKLKPVPDDEDDDDTPED